MGGISPTRGKDRRLGAEVSDIDWNPPSACRHRLLRSLPPAPCPARPLKPHPVIPRFHLIHLSGHVPTTSGQFGPLFTPPSHR